MSDSESSHGVPKPNEKFHDAKKRTDNEIKALSKSAKGKAGKEQVAAKEKEVETQLAKLKTHWDLYNRAENGEDVKKEYMEFTGEAAPVAAQNDILANPMAQRELTKAQKKKLEKEEREADEDKKRQELIKSLPDMCKDENQKITKRLTKIKLTGPYDGQVGARFHEVPGDGHCLFRSIRQQLSFIARESKEKTLYETWIQSLDSDFLNQLKSEYKVTLDHTTKDFTVEILRAMAACWIKIKVDDFVPFLFESDIFLNGGDIDTYCAALVNKDKVLWGGDCEISAFSAIFGIPILVVQAKGDNITFNQQLGSPHGQMTISFHQYWTAAGAHYNGIELLAPVEAEF